MHFQKVSTVVAVTTLLLSSVSFSQTKTADRLGKSIDEASVAALRGSIHPKARMASDRGGADPSMLLDSMVLTLKPTAEQQAGLEKLLREQQDRTSPNFHKWLTPEQYGDRFGVSANDFNRTVAWLQSRGFTIVDKARSRTWIAFSGTASQAAAAFHTQIHQYSENGRLRYANATDPAIPAALTSIVGGVRMHNFKPGAHAVQVRKLKPNFTSSISGNHYLAPDDFATIYDLHGLYNAGLDGTGQKIAVMGQTSLVTDSSGNLTDVIKFRSVSGLPVNNPTVILNGKNPGVVKGDIDEANLDVQWSGAVAPKAQIIYVNSGTSGGAFDSLQYAINNRIAPVISISYGDCEPNFSTNDINTITSWLQQAAAQGQTVVGPSGDSGAADCDFSASTTTPITIATKGLAVDVPASSPFVTGVGGTRFNEGTGTYWNTNNNANNGSALSYIPEEAWNDTAFAITQSDGLSASGGGISVVFTRPAWQTGVGVPTGNARLVPDISFAASPYHDGYLICSQGSCVNGYRKANDDLTPAGGTSAGVPVFAAIVALINQKTGDSQGTVNPTLYSLAATNPSIFNDITVGDNKVPCQSGTKDCPSGGGSIGYSAGVGYDLATGLGSLDASALVNAWPGTVPDFTMSSATTTLTITHGATATQTINLGAVNGYSGTLNLSCKVLSGLSTTACSLPATSPASGNVTLVINAASTLAGVHGSTSPFGWRSGGSLALFAGMVIFAGNSRKRSWGWLLGLVLVGTLLLMSGCGGSSSGGGGSGQTGGTTPLTGSVVVTATDGNLNHSIWFNVTVN